MQERVREQALLVRCGGVEEWQHGGVVGSSPAKFVNEKRHRCCVFELWFQSTLVTTWFCFVKVGTAKLTLPMGTVLPRILNCAGIVYRGNWHKGIEDSKIRSR